MEPTVGEANSIKVFAEYLKNLRAVNFYIHGQVGMWDTHLPLLSVESNEIIIPKLGDFKLVLDELAIQDCCDVSPRALGKSVLCYRLIVKPAVQCGSAAAEIICNFEKSLDEGIRNLVRNSINNVALKEGTKYRIQCRFCAEYLSDIVQFDRIRPLPSNNWVENAHELWYCHPPQDSNPSVECQDVTAKLSKINLAQSSSNTEHSKTVVELIQCPDSNYCFYGPCNWALNKDLVKGIRKRPSSPTSSEFKADCTFCGNELGNFTSEFCVRFWDYGVTWLDKSLGSDHAEAEISNSQNAVERAKCNFKSIVFATIHELSDNPTFRFTVSSTLLGNSVFLWNIDRNLLVYDQQIIPINSKVENSFILKCRKVAKFFFGVKENEVLPVCNAQEIAIIQETELNDQNILSVPHLVYTEGIKSLQATSQLYSRDEKSLQCGYLVYDS